jgi:hypothetical protein
MQNETPSSPLLVSIHGDGIGSGKTTLQLLLASFLKERGWKVNLASDDEGDARGMRLYDPALVVREAMPVEVTLLVSTTVLRSEQALPVHPCNTPRLPARPSAIRRFLGRLKLAAAVLCGAQPTGFLTEEQCWLLWKAQNSSEQTPYMKKLFVTLLGVLSWQAVVGAEDVLRQAAGVHHHGGLLVLPSAKPDLYGQFKPVAFGVPTVSSELYRMHYFLDVASTKPVQKSGDGDSKTDSSGGDAGSSVFCENCGNVHTLVCGGWMLFGMFLGGACAAVGVMMTTASTISSIK